MPNATWQVTCIYRLHTILEFIFLSVRRKRARGEVIKET